MPTTRQHPCRAAPPVPRRSRPSRYPSDKGSAAASRSTSTGACRAARSTAKTGCGQDRRRQPRGRAHAAGGRRWTDTGHHLALWQVTVAHDALMTVLGLQIGMLAEKVRDLGLDRLGQQGTCPIAQDFGELILDVSWLNQLDDVIIEHGISLLRWRSG